MSQARAKDVIYKHYSSHEGPGGGGEGNASDEDFEAFCQNIGESGSAHLFYLPAKGGGRGFHKFLSKVCDGDELHWHYDQTDFVVSIAIQSSESGGDFECVPLVRSASDENYDLVREVLHGRGGDAVATIPMTPGTLMLFEGRHSLHRVSPIRGPRPRYVALLAYDTKPGTDSSPLLKRVRYGRLPGEPVP
jgi:hypothetical protein